jgi:hypothetical protein
MDYSGFIFVARLDGDQRGGRDHPHSGKKCEPFCSVPHAKKSYCSTNHDPSQRGTAMREYRIFTIAQDGHFAGVPKIVKFSNDNEAIEKAIPMANGANIEIWSLERRIMRLPGVPAAGQGKASVRNLPPTVGSFF